MNNATKIDFPTVRHVVDPPIIDFLCYEPELKSLIAEFVPDPVFSDQRKESVYLYDGTSSARRVFELLSELTSLCGASSPIVKAAHAGGGNFSFYSADGSLLELRGSLSPRQTMDLYAVLQTLAQEIQLEFLRQRRSGQQQAV